MRNALFVAIRGGGLAKKLEAFPRADAAGGQGHLLQRHTERLSDGAYFHPDVFHAHSSRLRLDASIVAQSLRFQQSSKNNRQCVGLCIISTSKPEYRKGFEMCNQKPTDGEAPPKIKRLRGPHKESKVRRRYQNDAEKSKLRRLRESRGYTLTQLAGALDVDYSCLSRIERFEIRSLDLALKIVEFFGRRAISLEDILIKPADVLAENAEG